MLLNCHTYFSFCYGTLSPEELIDTVFNYGYTDFVLTDINNTSACIETIRLCQEKGITPRVGIDFRNSVQQQYIGIACNNEGFKELNDHLSQYLHNKIEFDGEAPPFNNSIIIYPFSTYTNWKLRENEFIGVSLNDLVSLKFLSSKIPHSKLVIGQSFSFINKRQYNAHRLLRAVDTNVLLSMLSKKEQANLDEIFLPKADLLERYSNYPQIIETTNSILNQCKIGFEFGKFANKNLAHYTNSIKSDIDFLRAECMDKLKYRYAKPTKEIIDRLEKELQIIEQMNFASYFLINWDIIKYAQHKNYYYVGRGSGANSIVAYILRITDVDPIELDLYFERFINPHRSNPPDFDIDFSWTDRDDITRYIFDRFGRHRTALVGTYSTFQKDAVIRELGKVFGIPKREIDKLQAADKHPNIDETGKQVLRYSELIQGMPSHLSIHASGIIISQESMTAYTATNLPPKGYPTTQFSMIEAEDIGLYKLDILSQRGLAKIKDSLDLIKLNQNVDIDIHKVEDFKKDEKVKDLLRQGKTIGCFYVESPAMRMLLTKLKADDYLRLVAASSIIRPGVSKSGMMREYIIRFRNEHLQKQARDKMPEFYDLLEETYGVMVYQEDVIKVAHYFADLTLAEADYLRRGMSWKFKQRSEFGRVRDTFFNNCLKKGYQHEFIQNVWNQIESFANFAFSKAHSASYAVESYQALYIKAHYPIEYMVATINNGGGYYRQELYIHEARLHGAIVHAPCVNKSGTFTTLFEKDVYLGLSQIAELEHETISKIIEERYRNGDFKDASDFINRVSISIEQIRLLIRVGGFNFTNKNKKELLWEVHMLINPLKKEDHTNELFEIEHKEWKLPQLDTNKIDEAFDEIQLLGFSLSSPFDILRDEIPYKTTSKDLLSSANQNISIVGYLVAVKSTYTSKGERMLFGTFIDLEGAWIDTVHFPPSAKQYPFQGNGTYILHGKITVEYDHTTLEVERMERMAVVDREIN